jgi:hypothetical protein
LSNLRCSSLSPGESSAVKASEDEKYTTERLGLLFISQLTEPQPNPQNFSLYGRLEAIAELLSANPKKGGQLYSDVYGKG